MCAISLPTPPFAASHPEGLLRDLLADRPALAAVAGDLAGGPPDEAQLMEDVSLSQAIEAAGDLVSAAADISGLLSLAPRPKPLTLHATIMEEADRCKTGGPAPCPGNFSEVLAQADTARIADDLQQATARLGDGIQPASAPQTAAPPANTRPVTVVGPSGVEFRGFSTVDQLGAVSGAKALQPAVVAGGGEVPGSKHRPAADPGRKRGPGTPLQNLRNGLFADNALAYNLLLHGGFPPCSDDDDDDVVLLAVKGPQGGKSFRDAEGTCWRAVFGDGGADEVCVRE